MGTRLVTNNQANTSFEQSTLPFGTALSGESTGSTNQRFTSYDRNTVASLDYAVNRSYSTGQGRFTTVDPIGMEATSMLNPQSNNLYAYVGNNPIDFTDPSGLFRLRDDEIPELPPIEVIVPIEDDPFEWIWDPSQPGRSFIPRPLLPMPQMPIGGIGGGEPGSGAPNPGTDPPQTDIPNNCKEALKKIGLLNKVQKLLDSDKTPFFDVNAIEDEKASKYFGKVGTKNLKVGQFFDRRGHKGKGATTVTTGVAGTPGIYSRGGEASLSESLKLHEVTHYAQGGPGNLDVRLARSLRIKINKGQDASQAVSNYFNNNCDPNLLRPAKRRGRK